MLLQHAEIKYKNKNEKKIQEYIYYSCRSLFRIVLQPFNFHFWHVIVVFKMWDTNVHSSKAISVVNVIFYCICKSNRGKDASFYVDEPFLLVTDKLALCKALEAPTNRKIALEYSKLLEKTMLYRTFDTAARSRDSLEDVVIQRFRSTRIFPDSHPKWSKITFNNECPAASDFISVYCETQKKASPIRSIMGKQDWMMSPWIFFKIILIVLRKKPSEFQCEHFFVFELIEPAASASAAFILRKMINMITYAKGNGVITKWQLKYARNALVSRNTEIIT